jgi:hypothetical protein
MSISSGCMHETKMKNIIPCEVPPWYQQHNICNPLASQKIKRRCLSSWPHSYALNLEGDPKKSQ